MSEDLQTARQLLATMEALLDTLTPGEERQIAERVRDNLTTCLSFGETSPRAAEVLLPSVITTARDYLNSRNA